MGLLDALRDEQFRQGMISGLRDAGQSASNAAAQNVAMPVDVLAWILRQGGMRIPQNHMGGSDWMKEHGLMRDVPKNTANMIAEVAGSVGPYIAYDKIKHARGLLDVAEKMK